jgi:tetratricopeptide (TPR) repeat protein
MFRPLPGLFTAFFLLASATFASSQQPTATDPAAAELQNCLRFIGGKQMKEAASSARNAEAMYRAELTRNPRNANAIVGLARTISQCQLPAADFATQGELSTEAIDLLESALGIDPKHWTARFVLASINYHSPAFLKRADQAAKHLDILLEQQGERTDNPRFARVFELRGNLYSQANKTDSALSLWRRGNSLFPGDAVLQKLAGTAPTATESTAPKRDSASARREASTAGIATMVIVASGTPTSPMPSQQSVSGTQVLMTAGAAADVFQAVQLQPGATRVSEGSDVYTRGGDPSETSLVVNGGRILSLSRFEGLSGGMFGALDPFVVKSVRYSTGGFSARHGNALSGVLEIETDGRPREREMRLGMSLVQASGSAHQPFGRSSGGWITARASNTAALLATHGRTSEFDGAPHSEEVAASFITAPTSLSEVRATVVLERDDSRRVVTAAGWTGPFHAASASRAVLVSSRWISGSKPLTIRASFAGSDKSSDWSFGALDRDRGERSLVTRVDADWAPGGLWKLRGGLESGRFDRTESGTMPTSSLVAPGSEVRIAREDRVTASREGGYAEAELTRGSATLVAGLRADRLPGEDEVTLDPRIAISTRSGDWVARLSGGLFHQGSWRAAAAIPDAGKPAGIAGSARHVVAGIERDGATSTFRAEVFQKLYSDFSPYGAGTMATSGTTRGFDLLAQRRSGGPVTGWIGYSLLDAHLQLVNGLKVKSPFDVTHSATASLTYTIGRDWSVGTTARYGTGAPFTPAYGVQQSNNNRPQYGPVLSQRLPSYQRIDARLMRFIRAESFLLATFVEVINVGDRSNVSAMTYDASYRARTEVPTFFSGRTIVAGGEFLFR